jgi:hypothetical protein
MDYTLHRLSHRCFEDINHDTIVKVYPLCSKYKYFLKAWLKAPVYGLFFAESKTSTKWVSKNGVLQGSVISPSLVNCVLDGLEKVVNEAMYFKKRSSSLIFFEKFRAHSLKNIKMFAKVLFLRVGADILILGKGSFITFSFILKIFMNKLKEKGLILKDTDTPILELKFGTYFDYLGFRFFYASWRKLKLEEFAFKKCNNPLQVAVRNLLVKNSNRFVITIQPKWFRNCCVKIQEVLSKSNTILPIKNLLRQYN